MAEASRDQNRIPTLLAVSSADGTTPVTLWADPTTHRLLVDLPAGGGDVVGPASATDNAIVRFDGTSGTLIQDSGIIIDDNNNISLPAFSAGSSNGTIYKGTITGINRFIHTFGPTGVNGANTFVGIAAGNFIMSGGGGAAFSSSYNTGIGNSSLTSLTGGSGTGYYNTAVGASSAPSLTTGLGNTVIGAFSSYQLTIGNANITIGPNSGYNSDGTVSSNIYIGSSAGYGVAATTTSSRNVGIGVSALAGVTTGGTTAGNVAVGYFTGNSITTGTRNTFLGYSSGSTLLTGSYNIIIGTASDGTALQLSGTGVSNEMNIGGFIFGNNSTKRVGIGLTDATSATATLHLAASTTSQASLRIPSGTAPSSPNDGDIWYDGTNLIYRSTTSQTIATATNTITFTNKTWNGAVIGLAYGGTAANLTASNGGIVYSTAGALAILSGTATAGQIIRSGASTTPSWSTATYPATAGTSGNVLTSDGTNFVSSAPASGGLALAGSDLTDRTTTSTSTTDLSSVTGLSIAAATPILVVVDWRKSGSAAEFAFFSIKVNGTTIYSEDGWSTSSGSSEYGMARFFIGPRTTNYVRGLEGSATRSGGAVKTLYADAADLPTANITSITITGKNQTTTANTVGTNNMRVYTLPTS